MSRGISADTPVVAAQSPGALNAIDTRALSPGVAGTCGQRAGGWVGGWVGHSYELGWARVGFQAVVMSEHTRAHRDRDGMAWWRGGILAYIYCARAGGRVGGARTVRGNSDGLGRKRGAGSCSTASLVTRLHVHPAWPVRIYPGPAAAVAVAAGWEGGSAMTKVVTAAL